jgi:pilus assembly protein FimV
VVDLPSAGLAAPPSFAGSGLSGAAVALADKASLEQAMALVTQATSAAQAAASAASAASERVLALERTVDQLRADALASRQLATQLRERLAQDDRSARWVFPLLVLVAVFGALAAWLAWRVARPVRGPRAPGLAPAIDLQQRALGRREFGNRLATAPLPFAQGGPGAAAGSAMPFMPSLPYDAGEAAEHGALRGSSGARGAGLSGTPWSAHAAGPSAQRQDLSANAARGRPASTPAWPPPAAPHVWPASDQMRDPVDDLPESAVLKTQPLSAAHRDAPQAVRDVSIEELIDMEQQAEFFVVLGQDEAAIDLLVDHLRGTGGSSPLPYLKLLEIYHRRGDEASYERMRDRFNHRFNAFAPPWGVDLGHGRDLAEYPGVLPRLAQVWPRPLDAMAELEALLFRKSRGDLFELPAYREVLFLYALARDLLDRQAAGAGDVDLLLPLADGSENSSTSPAPFLMQETPVNPGGRDGDERPTAPVDFDLSAPAPALSIFDVAGLTPRPAPAVFTRAF